MEGGSNPAFLFARRPACRQEAGRGGSCRSPQVRHAPRHADQRRPAPFASLQSQRAGQHRTYPPYSPCVSISDTRFFHERRSA